MKRVTLCLLLATAPALPLACLARAGGEPTTADPVPARVRACSVAVETDPSGRAGGSGTLFAGRDGKTYCLTAAHVVEAARGPVRVSRHLRGEDGRGRGCWAEADVVRTGAADDLALLCLGAAGLPGTAGARLYAGRAPGADTPVYACGSAGLFFHHSLQRGHVTALGRRAGRWPLLDEYDIVMGAGSSGGGVFLRTGELIGVHVASDDWRGALYVPARAVRRWAEEGNFLHCLDDAERIPAPAP